MNNQATYTRNQMFEVLTKCDTTLVVVAKSVERTTELVEKGGYTTGVIRRIGNASRFATEGICE